MIASSVRLLLLVALLVCTSSCNGRADDTLHLYTSLDAQEAPVYIDAFTKDTGIQVQWVRLSAGEALARLEAEKANPQVSLWFGGPSPEYIVAAQRGLLQPFTPQTEFALDSAAHFLSLLCIGFCRQSFASSHSMTKRN